MTTDTPNPPPMPPHPRPMKPMLPEETLKHMQAARQEMRQSVES